MAPALGRHAALDRALSRLAAMPQELAAPDQARRLAQELALLLQAGLLTQIAPPALWQAFCESRLDGQGGLTFGMLGPRADVDAILALA